MKLNENRLTTLLQEIISLLTNCISIIYNTYFVVTFKKKAKLLQLTTAYYKIWLLHKFRIVTI